MSKSFSNLIFRIDNRAYILRYTTAVATPLHMLTALGITCRER